MFGIAYAQIVLSNFLPHTLRETYVFRSCICFNARIIRSGQRIVQLLHNKLGLPTCWVLTPSRKRRAKLSPLTVGTYCLHCTEYLPNQSKFLSLPLRLPQSPAPDVFVQIVRIRYEQLRSANQRHGIVHDCMGPIGRGRARTSTTECTACRADLGKDGADKR